MTKDGNAGKEHSGRNFQEEEDEKMATKKRNIIVGQSGGPTSVINSSLAGVYKTLLKGDFTRYTGC